MARSRSIGGIYAELSLKDIQFRKGLKAAGMRLKSFAGTAAKAGAAAGGAMAAGLAVGSKRAISLGADLDHLSTQTGVNVAALMKLQQAYKDSGKSADSLGKDVGKMQRAIYDASQDPGGSMDYFSEMGMSAQALMAMSPEEQFFAIGKALQGVENQTKRSALALSIFGRSGAELMTVFEGSDLEDVNASLGKMPEIMEEFSGAMERADTLMGRLPNKADQFFAGFSAGVIGQLLPGLEAVNSKDFTELGKNLGDALAEGLNFLTDGTVWKLFELQGKLAMEKLRQGQESEGGLLNAWAAGINASLDWAFVGGEWGENFDKYAVAGIEANREIVDDLQKQIADLMTENRKRTKAKQAVAADIGTVPYGPNLPADWPPEVIETKTAPEEMEKQAKTWEESAYEVNSMQARGLAQGGVYRDKEKVKTNDLLTAIKDILGRAETDGTLKWA